jgi:integrase
VAGVLPAPIATAAKLRTSPYDSEALRTALDQVARYQVLTDDMRRRMKAQAARLVGILDTLDGETPQQRFEHFGATVWPRWRAGLDRPPGDCWTFGVRAAVVGRAVRPSWSLIAGSRTAQWVDSLPGSDPLIEARERLVGGLKTVEWASDEFKRRAQVLGVRLLLVCGYSELGQITDDDLRAVPSSSDGLNCLDAALCALGVFDRTPLQGAARRLTRARMSPAELVKASDIPERFQPVTVAYLDAYALRVSDRYGTLRHKKRAVAHFWRFIDERFPEIRASNEILPVHAKAFIPYAMELARTVRRGSDHIGDDRTTAHAWLTDVRSFFTDVCAWATEDGSPLTGLAPPANPIDRFDMRDPGFEQARRRSRARVAATIIDLERELPKIRAYALRRWHDAEKEAAARPDDTGLAAVEADRFWDWAIMELLVQSGLRIEEAAELTTLDVLKRRQSDGRYYYLLHVKPSKYDRARVIPIGDGLGRVIAEITRHVKRFYGTTAVPLCDRRDDHEKRSLPRAPYLLQGCKHPGPIGINTIRGRLARLSKRAETRTASGEPLILHPHDCRRAFASEHLNNNTPIHVIKALLGHASIDTVMVYAKLYPDQLVEEHRKAMRSAYIQFHGVDATRSPTAEEWAAFSANCSLRDMGTHLCALPTGEYCPKGLVCLGCSHAQPKRSAAQTFRRMLASHTRALEAAKDRGEPAGQIAARALEVDRIRSALKRAEELTEDVAAAIEASVS